ncbi:venom protein H precursor [Nasonia vitripennis]|uniref:Uncharacterized protein n=1 Tax=Nasonia vitripennis TaxID=7425 RepID=A0A7M6W8D1_NASVI|nr:venom protein H precursor [Nasonia vitripennis]
MKACIATLLLATVLLAANRVSAEPSLESHTVEACESKLAPIFQMLENVKEGDNFNYAKFCTQLKKGVHKACKKPINDICKKAPWKWLKFVCEVSKMTIYFQGVLH